MCSYNNIHLYITWFYIQWHIFKTLCLSFCFQYGVDSLFALGINYSCMITNYTISFNFSPRQKTIRPQSQLNTKANKCILEDNHSSLPEFYSHENLTSINQMKSPDNACDVVWMVSLCKSIIAKVSQNPPDICPLYSILP